MRAWFEKTMKNAPDKADGSKFTPLDRFVMELFRTINPNSGSVSHLQRVRHLLPLDLSAITTLHLPASMNPQQWGEPG